MSKKILLVEDTEDNRQILRDLLSTAGYDMIEGAAGCDDYVAQPFSPRQMLAKVREIIG